MIQNVCSERFLLVFIGIYLLSRAVAHCLLLNNRLHRSHHFLSEFPFFEQLAAKTATAGPLTSTFPSTFKNKYEQLILLRPTCKRLC